MSKGGMMKGQKRSRRQPTQPLPTPIIVNSKEHNNNSKGVPSSSSVPMKPSTTSTSTSGAKVLKEKNLPLPAAPSSSPIPPDDDHGLDVEELEVDLIDDDEDECEEDEDELDEDDEYDQDDACTEPCDQARVPNQRKLPNMPPSYNPHVYSASSSEDDEDEGEGDESLDREESDDEEEDEDGLEPSGFLLPADGEASIQGIPPDAQARLEAFFEAADGKLMSDPENLRKLTLTVSSALGEASAAINRMRDSQRKSLEEGRNDSMEEGDSLLALACSSGYFELARVLLAMGANVDDRGCKGDLTPLMDAASQGHLEIVKLLISHGADVNAQSASGNSPLMYAAAAGHEDIVKELLKANARVEENNENGHTPLMEAASSGHVGVAKILLENGAGINTSSSEFKESALTVACYKGHLEMVRYLLAAGADQQHKTDEMHTALMEASMDGHVEVARLLLDCGAQVNMPVDSFESPLTLAACGGHVELAELLIDRGANIEEVNDEGYTPLMEAAREGHILVVKCLIKAGAKVNAQTEETHETALTLAACGGFLDVVDALVTSGASIEIGASTPLMEASQEGHQQVVKYLLDKNADISRQTQTGDTALSYACENGHVDVVALLIEKGADPEHQSEGGRTPLMKACRGGHGDVIKHLLTKNVDVNRQTASNDHTPLSLACAGGHLAAVEVLLSAGANPYHKLKDNSTMIIEAARGGHTTVIRALLDHQGNDKSAQAPASQSNKTSGKNSGGSVQQKGIGTNNQGKSVLRKSRSTSTLDSSQPKGHKADTTSSSTATSGDAKSIKLSASAMTAINMDSPLLKNINLKEYNESFPIGDVGKNCSEESRKKPIPSAMSKASTIQQTQLEKAGSTSAAPQLTPASASQVHSQNQANICIECNSTSTLITPEQQQQPHGAVTKRAADASAGTSPSSSITTSPNAPLVPSQVTAATAISERPKAKANKPSAKRQVQLQQQIQHQLQQQLQQSQVTGSANGEVTNVAATSIKTVPTSSTTTATTPVSPPPAMPFLPSGIPNPTQVLQMQVQQLFTQQSQLIYKGDRKLEGNYEGSEVMTADIAQLIAASAYPHPLPPLPASSTPTSTTTTVVVTHGSGGTETVIEGDNLPPGTNEMIMSAAAAFPNGVGQLQVQSYQVSSETSMATTTLHSTTIINSTGGSIPQQILLPHHPPPLPIAFSEAAAAAGLVAPSGAPPSSVDGKMSQSHAVQQQPHPRQMKSTSTSTSANATMQSQCQKDKVAPKPTNPPQINPAALPKKQTAKRSRPFSQGPQAHHGSCANNHKGCTHHTATGTQTQNPNEKASKTLDVDSATESSGETSLSIAASLGHFEVVTFLLERKAHIEHRDKKGCTPLILAADGGHEKVVEFLLNHNAEIEAQSERTKDTALSLACTKGRYEVVDLLLKRGANKEHRNVSDYTPLSLAASGGFVNIIKLLLQSGAEINSRTGSKLGISPLMLAAMNGNTAAVKLLLDMGSDINAQIETNKNTALTLACFQGRHEVVQLLLDRKANLEHRAKTGLTPLMEAANGGYVEVGKVLIEKGADVNALPVPATRDTALTIAADKGHFRFVEMLIACHAVVDVRNKKGCTPLWLACNGGHLDVCQALQRARADVDAQDNRRISCLMASFRKGHVKVVRWIVKFVKQFPSDSEMSRYFLAVAGESELLKKSQKCMEYIKQAKDKQALEASKNANILLEELELEKTREESKKLAAAKRREKKKKKKQEKKQVVGGDDDREADNEDDDEADDNADVDSFDIVVELMDSGVDVNSVGSNSSSLDKKQKGNKGNKENVQVLEATNKHSSGTKGKAFQEPDPIKPVVKEPESIPIPTQTVKSQKKKKGKDKVSKSTSSEAVVEAVLPPAFEPPTIPSIPHADSAKSSSKSDKEILREQVKEVDNKNSSKEKKLKDEEKSLKVVDEFHHVSKEHGQTTKGVVPTAIRKGKTDAFLYPEPLMNISLNPPNRKGAFDETHAPTSSSSTSSLSGTTAVVQPPLKSPGQPIKGRKDDGWKEVTRSCPSSRSKKVVVQSSVISRVIGRGGCNINAIREATNAHIEVEKQQKGAPQPERTIQIKGTADATKQAFNLITALINEPDVDIKKLIPQYTRGSSSSSSSTNANGSVTPTPVLGSVSIFPIIGSASAPLPPIGQPLPAVAVANSDAKYGKQGSPTPKIPISSASPPISYIKTGSPPNNIKRPTAMSQNAANFEIGNFSVSEVPAEIFTKSYNGKKSLIFTNSGTTTGTGRSAGSSFNSKQQPVEQHWGDSSTSSKARNPSPSPAATPSQPTNTVPFSTAVPSASPNQHQRQQQTQQHGQQLPAFSPKDSDTSSNSSTQYVNGPTGSNNEYNPPRNLAPGKQAVGSNRSNAPNDRSSEASHQDQPRPDQQATPLEYSPFNYTFSKTTGWFPGDLAVPSPTSNNSFGVNNLISNLVSGHTSALSAARAMNFASVAASGISSSMSTSTAAISQAGNNVGSSGITAIGKQDGLMSNQSHRPQQQDDHTKANAAKAPGYRGNTSMGSPVMRMQHPQMPQHGAPTGFNMDSPPSMNPNLLNFNNRSSYTSMGSNGQFPPQDMGIMNSQPVNGGVHNMYQNNNSGHTPVPSVVQQLPPPPPLPVNANPTVPTNVVLSSRLNPRAPSFMVKVQPGQQQPPLSVASQQQQQQQQQPQINSAFASAQPNYIQPIQPQQYKGIAQQQQQQYGGGQQQRRLGSSWAAGYSNGSLDDISGFQGLGGMMDPAVLIGGMEGIHDNQSSMKIEDRRLPRPIGGERNWKSSSSSSCGMVGNNAPTYGIDGLEHGPTGSNNWSGMYGSGNPAGFPTNQNQGIPPSRGDRGGNVLGRRFIEEMDANRILEMQQIYDGQRLMNGGNAPMMHMQNSMPPHPNVSGMFPYGLEHIEQQHAMPKLDQSWDAHLLDDKLMQQGWGNKWGN